nr:TlyA family RNA methyltransferase [uncultured Helicobacter sp.]
MRLDVYVKSLCSSRTKAKEAIESGCVKVNGIVVKKGSFLLEENDRVSVDSKDLLLSRAGYKLRGFIESLVQKGLWDREYLFHKRAIDIGASTGGFTQVLLESGIDSVVCVDVGKNQLHSSIVQDERIRVFEECDIRDFSYEGEFDIMVCDVSFISLYKLMESFERLNVGEYIWLFKPQFEVGIEAKRNKKGVLKDKSLGEGALKAFCEYLKKRNFSILASEKSVMSGKEGNEEFFVYARR